MLLVNSAKLPCWGLMLRTFLNGIRGPASLNWARIWRGPRSYLFREERLRFSVYVDRQRGPLQIAVVFEHRSLGYNAISAIIRIQSFPRFQPRRFQMSQAAQPLRVPRPIKLKNAANNIFFF